VHVTVSGHLATDRHTAIEPVAVDRAYSVKYSLSQAVMISAGGNCGTLLLIQGEVRGEHHYRRRRANEEISDAA
jgi:hypothetical protein